jgi:NAD(P)-dependent dehydrogenase (short-subunit alcohol dehydrogenase family)
MNAAMSTFTMNENENENENEMVVVVTGASAGIGRAVVRAFAGKGVRIGLIARGEDGLEAAAREVEAKGGVAVVARADVANEEEVEAAASKIEAELGPIDIWINNAMVSVFARADEITPDEFRRVTDVTYLGYVWGTLAALRRMKRDSRRRGTIVQVGSALAYRAIPLQSAYCAAKHAVKGFSQSLRTELLHDGLANDIHIVMVELPAVNTPQFDWSRSRMPRRAQPVPPIFQPELAAEAIRNAALHPRREMLVGGPTVLAVAAERIAPSLADRWLARTGVEAQMTAEPSDPSAPDNLYRPLKGDRGARGRFSARARRFSPQVWATQHRRRVGVMASAAGLLIATAAVFLLRPALARKTSRR